MSGFFTKKKISLILGMIVAVVGIGVGVYLVGQQQLLTKKAETAPIIFKDPQGNPLLTEDGTPVSQSLNVKVELNAP